MTYPAAIRLQDKTGRALRADRIAAILKALGHVDLASSRVLDLGASHLYIARGLVSHGAHVVALDLDLPALKRGLGEGAAQDLDVVCAVGEALPFADESFDVVICNHIYEHVSDPERMLDEIQRVLIPGGVCYFAGGHKYQLIEPHYRLPCLSWLPGRLSDRYLRASGRGQNYDIRFMTVPGLRALARRFANAQDVTSDVLRRGDEFRTVPAAAARALRYLPESALKALARLSPTHIWLLRKPRQQGH